MSIIILTAVQCTSSINVVKEIAKTVLWRQCKNLKTDILLLFALLFSPLSLFVTNNGSKTYGNPLLTLFILFFLFPYFISFLFFSFPFFFFFSSPPFFRNSTSTCLAWKRGKLGVARGKGQQTTMAAATHKTISTTFSSHCFNYRYIVQAPRRSQAVLESLTQIPVNVGRNEWSLRKSFFRTTSRDADPCFLPVRESPPLRYCCYFDFVSLFNHIIHSPLSFQTRHRKATIVEIVSRNA